MSRDEKPKQFHSFIGDKTMIQQTYERLNFLKKEDIFVATNARYSALVKKQLPRLNAKNLIIEPAMRDTGSCICYAAHHLAKLGFGDEAMVIVYADHLIQNTAEFERALKTGAEIVKKEDTLAVIAVKAKYPNPSLGYIKIGKLEQTMENGLEVYILEQFVEKPTVEKAKQFLKSYKYLWNTGLYMWKTSTILELFKKLSPEIFKATANKKTYADSPKISIDYALIEKLPPRQIRVIPAELGWNDIGNWAALHDEVAKNEKENVSSGEHISIDTEGSVVFGNSGKPIVTYGLRNMVVIDTPEALLIMPKEKSCEAKNVTEELKKRKKENLL